MVVTCMLCNIIYVTLKSYFSQFGGYWKPGVYLAWHMPVAVHHSSIMKFLNSAEAISDILENSQVPIIPELHPTVPTMHQILAFTFIKFQELVMNGEDGIAPKQIVTDALTAIWSENCVHPRNYVQGLTLIPAWISNYMPRKVWDKITYPFPKLQQCWSLGMDK